MKRIKKTALICLIVLLPVMAVVIAKSMVITNDTPTDTPDDTHYAEKEANDSGWFEIQVMDEETGRGVPLVELETIDHRRFVSDSAGRIAIGEPDLMNKPVFFYWRSHGYKAPVIEGIKEDSPFKGGLELKLIPGGRQEIKVKRLNNAQRLYRITGAGMYRDSVLLGYEPPVDKPLLNGEVLGQDGGHCIVYKDKIYWGYGDTGRLSSLWGTWNAPMCVSELPENGGLDPDIGTNAVYFEQSDGFVKGMWPEIKTGAVWPLFLGIFDIDGEERLVMFYNNVNSDWSLRERGLGVYDDEKQEMKVIHRFGKDVDWRYPDGWGPIIYKEDGKEWLHIGKTIKTMRIPADIESLKDPSKYEAYTCIADGYGTDPKTTKLLRDSNGRLVYRWTKNAPPMQPDLENEFIKAGLMERSEAMFIPVDVETGADVVFHTGTIYWNEYRQKWVALMLQQGGISYLGEVWYAEADSPIGPWKKAIKIASHDSYSFYNPSHLPFYDKEGGKIIYFDGCYSMSFATNDWTQRYDYNMVRYKLDLTDPRMQKLWE